MPIRKPTESPRPAPVRATRPATDVAGAKAGAVANAVANAEHASDVGVTRPQTAGREPVDDKAARALASQNAGSGAADGPPLLSKTSPVGAFFHKQVALPAPAQVYEALRALPLSAFAADVEALWRLGEEQGQIKDGKLHPLSLEIVDRRLHNAMARATFEVALGVTRDELRDIVRRATLSALREMPGHDGIPWGQLGAFLSPPERDLVATAMANLGAPRKAARQALDDHPPGLTAFISADRLARGLEAATDSLAASIVLRRLEQLVGGDAHARHDPFLKRLADELGARGQLPLAGDERTRRRAMLAAAGVVLARDYAGADGIVDLRMAGTPGKRMRQTSNITLAPTLLWEVLAATVPQTMADLDARARVRVELDKTAGLVAAAMHIDVDEARDQILASLAQRREADGPSRALVEDMGMRVDTTTGQPLSIELGLARHLADWNAAADAIPRTLPMVERAKARIPDDAFRGHLVLTVQHFLGPFVPLMNALKDKGAETTDMIHVGVPYSANPQVELALRAAGNDVRVPSTIDQMKDTIRHALAEVIERSKAEAQPGTPGKPILVIDDGGTVTELLQEVFPTEVHRFCIIEQTTRGITAATKAIEKGRETGFVPSVIVDVARSEAKSLEGVQIAPTAMDSLEPAVKARAAMLRGRVAAGARLPTSLAESRPLVFGFGVIGASMARAFKDKGLDVAVWDRDPALRDKARAEGFCVPDERDEVFRGRDLIVGCTGFPSIQASDIPKMEPHALATSLSSKRIEFDAQVRVEIDDFTLDVKDKASQVRGWQKLGTYQARTSIGTDEQLDRSNNHTLVQLTVGREGRPGPIIVNDMQPINFDHDVFVVPALHIQLTEALLLDGAYQAVRDKAHSGIIPYDRERQKQVLADWAELKPSDEGS